ncbi:hypothetical protein E2C01_052624 [Portunus trituberculatus]|uniref:Uncharacterized protein n=1 Tax=Portunus trituberculatus TaxID=210409 RepID=A0A5B7GN01_PORTR|nr:hypothetical protein [Portunus trituberculatus]
MRKRKRESPVLHKQPAISAKTSDSLLRQGMRSNTYDGVTLADGRTEPDNSRTPHAYVTYNQVSTG